MMTKMFKTIHFRTNIDWSFCPVILKCN